jgi:hypothetical protein
MIPVAILGFLIGAAFAWGFRAWILVPVTLILVVSLTVYQWSEETKLLPAIASGLLVSIMPQLGYAFGLVTRAGVLMPRVPRTTKVTFWQGDVRSPAFKAGNPVTRRITTRPLSPNKAKFLVRLLFQLRGW